MYRHDACCRGISTIPMYIHLLSTNLVSDNVRPEHAGTFFVSCYTAVIYTPGLLFFVGHV